MKFFKTRSCVQRLKTTKSYSETWNCLKHAHEINTFLIELHKMFSAVKCSSRINFFVVHFSNANVSRFFSIHYILI